MVLCDLVKNRNSDIFMCQGPFKIRYLSTDKAFTHSNTCTCNKCQKKKRNGVSIVILNVQRIIIDIGQCIFSNKSTASHKLTSQ